MKEQLELRLKQLEGSQGQAIAKVNVIAGQIFELKYQIDQYDKKDQPKPTATKLEQVVDNK